MSPSLAAPVFVCSLGVTLAAARVFARRLDRLGLRFGFPEALIGLLTALAADGPEISTALAALAKGAHSVGVGVLVGSNVFNLAAMIGLSAVLVGRVRLPREMLVLEGLVAVLVTLIAAAVLLDWLAPLLGLLLLACVLIPYLFLLVNGPQSTDRRPVASVPGRVPRVVGQRRQSERPRNHQEDRARHLVALMVLDVGLIVAGSAGMVQSALALGDRWGISGPVLGVLILAPLTSIPNAMTAVRLGFAHRGSALVSETFNSNTINLAAGVVVPALFIGVTGITGAGKLDIAWLIAITTLCLVLLARPGGMRRNGGIAVIVLYAAFVATQLLIA